MTIFGTAGNDDLTGTAGVDEFDVTQGGRDKIHALGGADIIIFGNTLAANDEIDGGADFDTVRLDGNYGAGLVFSATTMVNVEEIELATGHNYSLTTNDATVAEAGLMTIDGSAIDAAHSLVFDGSNETNAHYIVNDGLGDDTLTGSAGGDTFNISGGEDVIDGGGNFDHFFVGASLDRDDRIDGGADFDTLHLDGDYSAGFVFKDTTAVNIETFTMATGHSYDLVFQAANITLAGLTLITGSGLGVTDTLHVDASDVDNAMRLDGGHGDDVLIAGSNDDLFVGIDGTDTLMGKGGDDGFNIIGDPMLTTEDRIDGGTGDDHILLAGNYSTGLVLNNTIVNVETLTIVNNGTDYKFTAKDPTVAASATLFVDASSIDSGNTLNFKGAAEQDGSFRFFGTTAGDTLTGGHGDDEFTAGGGADTMKGGAGADQFNYLEAADSTGTDHDAIKKFNAADDRFDTSVDISGVDATVDTGTLRSNHFDTDLEAAIGTAELDKSHAVLFTADGGDLAGKTFLIVDFNDTKGYQAGDDVVIELQRPSHLGAFDADNFI